jgi:hypothetical protein
MCQRHAGPPTSDMQLTVVQGEIRTNGATASFGPFCIQCLVSTVHTLALSMPESKGGRATSTRRIKRLSQKQEASSAAATGARVQPGSGARPGNKGDTRRYGIFREESKFTFAQSFSLKKEILDKIRGECQGREEPVVNIEFRDKATGRVDDNWVVVPRHYWEKLIASTDNS